MKRYLFSIFLLIIILSIYAEDNLWNIYDPDSLAVIALLDSNDIPNYYFQDVIWAVMKVSPNDSDFRIARLILRPQNLPKELYCLPPEIGNLFCLNWLEIPYHNLQNIPDEISKLENVGILDLRYNPLKSIQ